MKAPPPPTANVDRWVAARVHAGTMTPDDAYTVLKFADYLRQAGPRMGPWTADQWAFREHTLTDPEWREYLGIDDLLQPCGCRKDATGHRPTCQGPPTGTEEGR